MNTKRITWISIILAALILAAILAFQTLVVGNVMAAANSPVGSWTVTAKSNAGMPPPITIRLIFSSDGTLTEIEDSGAVGLGVWEKLSGNQYAFTSLVYVPQGADTWQAKVISTITLNDKEHYSGPYFFELRNQNGDLMVNGFGTATGVRNHVEPMPK